MGILALTADERVADVKFRDCSKDTGLSHHAALALCRILVV